LNEGMDMEQLTSPSANNKKQKNNATVTHKTAAV
jgi:hypothetical protein